MGVDTWVGTKVEWVGVEVNIKALRFVKAERERKKLVVKSINVHKATTAPDRFAFIKSSLKKNVNALTAAL